MRFKIDWASLIVGRKFTVFAFFTLYLRAIFKYKSPGGLIFGGQFNGGFFALRVWGAYIWRGLFSESYGISYPSITKKNMLTSGPRCGTWRGTVLTSNVLDRHSITVMSEAERHDEENIA